MIEFTIKRMFSVPTNLSSFEDFGTFWVADFEEGAQVWIQTSFDKNEPKWIRYGDWCEKMILAKEKI